MATAKKKKRSKKGRDSKIYSWWREHIKRRDGYRCLLCGSNNQAEVHHIERWIDNKALRFDVTNGVTLCLVCHNTRHNYVGKAFSAEDTLDVYTRLIALYTKTIPRGTSEKCRNRIRVLVGRLQDRASVYSTSKSTPTKPPISRTILRKKNPES